MGLWVSGWVGGRRLVLIIIDFILVPLQIAFGIADVAALMWISPLFWSWDVVMSFFVGYYSHGKIRMEWFRVARHYLITWFFIDVLVVTCDWLALTEDIGGSYIAMARAVRAIRLVRIAKLSKILFASGSYVCKCVCACCFAAPTGSLARFFYGLQ